MDAKKLEIAVRELGKWNIYPIEYRIAKYLIKAGYSGRKQNMNKLINQIDPTMSIVYTNRIWNTMQDIESITTEKNKYHINNIPDLKDI